MKKYIFILAVIALLSVACVTKTMCYKFYPLPFGILSADRCGGTVKIVVPDIIKYSDQEIK